MRVKRIIVALIVCIMSAGVFFGCSNSSSSNNGIKGQLFTKEELNSKVYENLPVIEIETEEQYKGFGISVCATCDGYFYKNKDVAVVGGGNTACEEALYLANFVRSVTLIHRRETLRADIKIQKKLQQHPKINIKYDVTIEKFFGENKKLKAIKIKNVKNDKEEIIKVDGVFIAIGHKPNTEFLRREINLDKN